MIAFAAIGVIVEEWLVKHDPTRSKQGTRRLPDTSGLPGSRYVPSEVDREPVEQLVFHRGENVIVVADHGVEHHQVGG